MPVLREQRRREFATHFWGPTTFFSKNAGRWTESGALERERRSWTSDRSSSPPGGAGDRDDRPVAELHLGLEARSSSSGGVKSTSAYSPGRTYAASSSFGDVVSVADVSAASRGTMASSSSFGYEPARFGFLDEPPRSSSGGSSGRGFSFGGGEARELNFVPKPAQQQQQQQHHGHHHQQQHRQQQSGRSSPGPFSEPTAFGSEPEPSERDSDLEIGVLRSDWRGASGGSSGSVGARAPGASSASTAQQQQPGVGAVAVPGGGGGGGSAGGGDAQSPPMSSGAPCGACKFLRRKCVRGCIFAPYFGAEQGAARFAAVHKIFGASNVSKLLLHIPLPKRCDAVLTISYEAQARISDPVYGCVATIFALQQQVASLQAELAMVQSQLSSRLAAAALQQQQQQQQHVQQQHHQTATSAYDTSAISMSIPSPNQNVTGGSGPGSVGPYGGSSNRVKEEASFHTFHYDVGMGGSSMSIDSAANQHQHLLHLDSYNVTAQKAAATRHLLGDHSRAGEADMGELQALAHALLRRK